VTPDRARAPGHDARSRAGRPAADLGAIRRSDAVIDLLAGRRRIGARALRDPAVALLRGLNADVDATAFPARLAGRRRAGRHHAPGSWPHAAAAAAVAAAIATLTAVAAAALVLVGVLARLSVARARPPSPPPPPGRRRW
jgi:hypothetical protein